MKLITLFLITLAFANNCYSQEIFSFEVKPCMIDSLTFINPYDNEYSIIIKLDECSGNNLENITKNNIDKTMLITYNNYTILEAIIKIRISSGVIVISNLDKEKYQRLWKVLNE